MRERLARTAISLAVVLGAVFAVRWAIRAAMSHAYRAESDAGAVEMPVVPAPRVHLLASIVPPELHVNVAGMDVRRHRERLNMPYALATELAEEKAKSAGWERLDDENALTMKNLSGMERVYKTPDGSIVLREVRAIRGEDSVMEDFVFPAGAIPEQTEQTTPESLARRAARRVKELMPPVLRDVVAGSPMMTELIERGGGAAFIVHCVAETSDKATSREIEAAARKAGWKENDFAGSMGGPAAASAGLPVKSSWTKENLTFFYEVVSRPGGGCDVDYRFTDDEVYIQKKGQTNED